MPRPRWRRPGSPTTCPPRPAPIWPGSSPARRRSCRPGTPSCPRDGRRSSRGRCEPLWFEEGDGVAVLENGKLLAVIPGWSDAGRGMPGYSRDIIGPDAVRLVAGRRHGGPRPPGGPGQGVLEVAAATSGRGACSSRPCSGHLPSGSGPGAHYWDASCGKQPLAGVSERPPTPDRPYTVLSTVGHELPADAGGGAAGAGPGSSTPGSSWPWRPRWRAALAARVFLWLAPYPWRAVTWFGPGHSVRWYHEPATFPLGGGHEAVLLLDEPGGLAGPGRAGPVRLLVRRATRCAGCGSCPITEQERLVAKEQGSST